MFLKLGRSVMVSALLAALCHASDSYQDFYNDLPGANVGNSGAASVSLGTNSTLLGNNSLADALAIVSASQSESRLRNVRLLASPRKNEYVLHHDRAREGNQLREDGTITALTSDGTGLNATVGATLALVAEANARNKTSVTRRAKNGLGDIKRASGYWMENMVQNGMSPLAPPGYKVWRNVKDYGARGDGIHDDTEAINKAISDGNRCGQDCGSSTVLQAVVYFPAGTYLINRSIVAYYFTQIIGDATNPPTIKVASTFSGLGAISSDVYIEGGNGASWYINQNNFYRQIRNFVIDMTEGPKNDYIAGLHWQVAQATSLQNIKFKMSTSAGNNQQGIFMENGSGGVMNDLEFIGGSLGAYVGNQQFTVRNLKFSGQATRALEIHWDWGWTWKGVHIQDCPVGVVMWGPDPTVIGSAIFLDSSFNNVGTGFELSAPTTNGKVTLNLFNVLLTNVQTGVRYKGGYTLLAGGTQTIKAWGVGKRYDTTHGEAAGVWQDGTHYPHTPDISSPLTDGSNGFFARTKPQYENVDAGNFVNLKSTFGAVGDGKADDTSALNRAFRDSAGNGRILWIPAGIYLVSDTVIIPPGAKVVGQLWAQIMGVGPKFSDVNKPYPVVKVGNKGDVGSVEIQDLLFTVKGATAGAIILEWNIHQSSQGSAAMWDTHIRVGGALGSDLQSSNCPKLTGKVNKSCIAASMLVHITSQASAYFQNTWFWVADHDLDTPAQTQIDIYVGRGFLIESTGPVWLYGTASEHCVLYQYQTVNAANVFMGMIQTESPYYQLAPPAPEPFPISTFFPSDPKFDNCAGGSQRCAFSWGVRVLNSVNIYVYGAGLYSWFNKYDQACVASEDCQDRVFDIQDSSSIWIYSLITKAVVEMISPGRGTPVIGKDNKVNYCDIVMAWLGNAGAGSNSHVTHRSPASATVIPFPAVTVKPTQTFTIAGPVASQVDNLHNDGNQNTPPGPGEDICFRCDLIRLITSTCCGIGGGVSNPIEIGPSTPVPRSFFLPGGFIPNQEVTGADGIIYPAGKPLPREVLVPIGTTFPVPFLIPPGLPLSDTWTDDWRNNDTLFLPATFWDQAHTVTCNDPCAIIFPPSTTITTWTPSVITYVTKSTTTSTTIPPYTTQSITISRTKVSRTQPTQTIHPIPGPKPYCFKIPIIGRLLCPPKLDPFPPPIPPVTLVPVPPGGKPGPTEEPKEEEDSCSLDLPDFDIGDGMGSANGYDDSYPGAGRDIGRPNTPKPGAGTGTPQTQTVTVQPTKKPAPSTTSPATPSSYTVFGPNSLYTLVCETSTSTRMAGYPVTLCAGSPAVLYPPGIKPTLRPDPDPEPENGWYDCDDGESGPFAQFCPRGQSILGPQPAKCGDLCDQVLRDCPKGKNKVYISGKWYLGAAVQYWWRSEQSFGDERDCPTDKDNCMYYCKMATSGTMQRGQGYIGAAVYPCDKTGKITLATITDQGSCAPTMPGGPFKRYEDAVCPKEVYTSSPVVNLEATSLNGLSIE